MGLILRDESRRGVGYKPTPRLFEVLKGCILCYKGIVLAPFTLICYSKFNYFCQRMVIQVKITRQEVEHVALLARLELTEEEVVTYTEQLNSILDYAAMLDNLNTEEILPTAHALPLHNVLREDQVHPSLEREKVLANAPEAEEGFFKVPRIV